MGRAVAEGVISSVDRRLDGRHDIRLSARGRAVYQLDADANEPMQLFDISFGGCQARTSKFTPPQRVIIDLPIVGERRAEVRWAKGRKIGCRFSEALSREELRALIDASAAGG